MDNYIELFNPINRIYIATDNDIKGIELKAELIKRFGSEKCSIVSFKDCKDANQYLVKYGGIALNDTLKNVTYKGAKNRYKYPSLNKKENI